MPESPTPLQGPRLKAIVEALVFAAEDPLTLSDLVDLFPGVGEATLRDALVEVMRDCDAGDRGVQVTRVAGGYRMTTKGDLGEWVRALFRSRNRRRLSAAALETLAIVAYRQPITTPEIQAVRGTDPSSVLEALLEKGLVRVLGRKKVVGKPILYGTTKEFLAHFGLDSLEDLPSPQEFGGSLPVGARPLSESRPVVVDADRSGPFQENEEQDDGEGAEEYDDDGDDEVERQDDGDDS